MVARIGDGAEAIIYLDGDVVKERIAKGYRLFQIDEKLRKFRTRREAKVLEKLAEISFPSPRLVKVDDKEMKIVMNFVDGKRVRDVLTKTNCVRLGDEIGKKLAILHNNGIIHQDMTTSNMIYSDEIYFIDFGLSFFSGRIEDMAVDLHLLRQALESKHYQFWKECYEAVIDSYTKECKYGKLVVKRLEKVEGRGRYKSKH